MSGFPGFRDLQNLVRGPEISDFRHFSDFSGTLAKTSKSGKSGIFLPPLMETTSPGNLRILSFSDNFLTFLSNLSRDSEIIQVPELSILICPSCDCLDLIMWVKKWRHEIVDELGYFLKLTYVTTSCLRTKSSIRQKVVI